MTSRGDSTKLWFEKRRCWTPCIPRQVSVCIFYVPAWARVFLLQRSKRVFVWSPSHLLQISEGTWHQMRERYRNVSNVAETNNNITIGISWQPKKMQMDVSGFNVRWNKWTEKGKKPKGTRGWVKPKKEHKGKEEEDKKIKGKKKRKGGRVWLKRDEVELVFLLESNLFLGEYNTEHWA